MTVEPSDKDRDALITLNVAVKLAVEALDQLPQTADPTLREDIRELIARIEAETERLLGRIESS